MIYDKDDNNPVVADTDQVGCSFYTTPKRMESEHAHISVYL